MLHAIRLILERTDMRPSNRMIAIGRVLEPEMTSAALARWLAVAPRTVFHAQKALRTTSPRRWKERG